MQVKKLIGRAVESALKPLGLQITKVSRDFDCRPTGHALDRMLSELAGAFDTWCAHSQIWPLCQHPDTLKVVAEFYEAFLTSPFRAKGGGSRFNNLLWLHLLARASQPSVIIDSGTYRGASAWAFATAVPKATVLSFDIDLTTLAKKAPGVTYLQQDWTTYPLDRFDLSNALAYFDDHVDQGARLAQVVDRGIPRLVFDDDFSVTSFASMAHGGAALPKIAFILDESLHQVDEVTWHTPVQSFRWRVDHARLKHLHSLIARTERLPNTSRITDIHQTPYRLVRTDLTAPTGSPVASH